MYKLAVKLDGIERRKRTTGLLHIIAGFFLVLKSVDYWGLQQQQGFRSVVPFFMVGILSLLYGVFKKWWDPAARLNRWVRLLQVCVFTMLALEFIAFGRTIDVIALFAWAIGCLLLMFTERKVFHDAEMQFGKDGIFIPGYFTNRRLFWAGIKEVVVRPDFVTIFQSNDSFLQYEVMNYLDGAVLDEITLYCKEQIYNATKTS